MGGAEYNRFERGQKESKEKLLISKGGGLNGSRSKQRKERYRGGGGYCKKAKISSSEVGGDRRRGSFKENH